MMPSNGPARSSLAPSSIFARATLALLAEISAVLVAIKTLVGDASGVGQLVVNWPGWAKLLLVAALVILGIALVQPYLKFLSRPSRLMRPERFRLDAGNPAHLVGREEDIAAVERACLDSSLVWLTGESGVGKSALLRAGLVPKLRAAGQMLPVYLESWGRDWERSPRRALADALCGALGPVERDELGLEGPASAADVAFILGRIRDGVGRTPVLIFDQFDDYQMRHREKFLPDRRRAWLRAVELVELNGFWREIDELIRSEVVRAIFVTRDDGAIGLESVRFVEPECLSVFRLPAAFTMSVFDRVTADDGGGAVIIRQERGWEQLKQRVGHDLAQGTSILPQQVKTVLLGLRDLSVLTVRNYRRAGGLAGIEAQFVESAVSRVTGHRGSPLTSPQARSLLVTFIDKDASSKTTPLSLDDLIRRMGREGRGRPTTRLSTQDIEGALKAFESAELVRVGSDPDREERVWQLDHDYLCHAVLHAERKANRWFFRLREGHEEFRAAGRSLRRRWRALLSMRAQLHLATLRLVGRFRYGEHRTYALWSLLRFAPIALFLFYFVDPLANGLGLGRQLLEEVEKQDRMAQVADDLEFLGKSLQTVGPKLDLNGAAEAAAAVAAAVPVAAQMVASDPGAISSLAKGLGALPDETPGAAAAAREIAAAIGAAAPAANTSSDLMVLVSGLQAVVPKLDLSTAGQCTAAIATAASPLPMFKTFGEDLRATPEELDGSAARKMAGAIAAAAPMIAENNPRTLGALGVWLATLPEGTSGVSAAAREVAGAIALAAPAVLVTDPLALRQLGDGLSAMAPVLDPEAAGQAAAAIALAASKLEAMATSAEGDEIFPLYVATRSAPHPKELKLDSRAASSAAANIAVIATRADPQTLGRLSIWLSELPEGPKVAAAIRDAASAIAATAPAVAADPESLSALRIGVQALAPRLDRARAGELAAAVEAAVPLAAEPEALQELAWWLQALPNTTLGRDAAVRTLAKSIAVHLTKPATHSVTVAPLAAGLAAVAPDLDVDTAAQAAAAITTALLSAEDTIRWPPADLHALAEVLGALPKETPGLEAAGREIAEAITGALPATVTGTIEVVWELQFLSAAVGALPNETPSLDDVAREVAATIAAVAPAVVVTATSEDSHMRFGKLVGLGNALAALPGGPAVSAAAGEVSSVTVAEIKRISDSRTSQASPPGVVRSAEGK